MNTAKQTDDDCVELLLGRPTAEIIALWGEPIGEYSHRNKDVLLFNRNDSIVSCEVSSGIVRTIDASRERRAAPRIKPVETEHAYLRYSTGHNDAVVLDLSIKSFALQIVDNRPLPEPGDLLTFCTKLQMGPTMRTHVTFAGQIYKVMHDSKTVIVLLRRTVETHSLRLLADYINMRTALTVIGKRAMKPGRHDGNVVVVKSDLCSVCHEGACRLNELPRHDAE